VPRVAPCVRARARPACSFQGLAKASDGRHATISYLRSSTVRQTQAQNDVSRDPGYQRPHQYAELHAILRVSIIAQRPEFAVGLEYEHACD
jgi:hypothetical protein